MHMTVHERTITGFAELMGDACKETGRYILRQGRSQNQWVMTVAFKGKPTHHILNGAYLCILINKKMFGSYQDHLDQA